MNAIRNLFGASPPREQPARVASDVVYPVHSLDDTKTIRGIVVTWTLYFNDVLDADKLHTSLSKLLEIGDWKKVGGRLRLTENGNLEIHVPQPFSATRPPIFYAHQNLPVKIEDHSVASKFPKASSEPSIQTGPQELREFAAPPNAPETIEDFIYSDAPLLSLYITSFNNATLVSLSWPHTLMDVLGQHSLSRSWCLILAGQESEAPPVLGAQEDAISAIADAPVEKEEAYVLAHKRLRGLSMAFYGFVSTADMMLLERTVETRTICLPKKTVERLREEAHYDLTARGGQKLGTENPETEKPQAEKPQTEKPSINEGELLTAWSLRAVAASLSEPRPMTVLHDLNARFLLPTLANASGVYIQNMPVAAFRSVSHEMATGTLGDIVLETQRQLMEQSREPQVLAYLRELRKEQKTGGDPASMLFCDSNALLLPLSDWTRADFFKTLDFSPAVVRAGETGSSRNNPPGTMLFHHTSSMRPSATVRNSVVVLGKDHDENYWLTGTLLPRSWLMIEEELKRL